MCGWGFKSGLWCYRNYKLLGCGDCFGICFGKDWVFYVDREMEG